MIKIPKDEVNDLIEKIKGLKLTREQSHSLIKIGSDHLNKEQGTPAEQLARKKAV